MADWSDVVEMRREASDALGDVNAYGGSIEDGRESDVGLAVCLATRAICAELRAFATLLDERITAANGSRSRVS